MAIIDDNFTITCSDTVTATGTGWGYGTEDCSDGLTLDVGDGCGSPEIRVGEMDNYLNSIYATGNSVGLTIGTPSDEQWVIRHVDNTRIGDYPTWSRGGNLLDDAYLELANLKEQVEKISNLLGVGNKFNALMAKLDA